MADTNADNAAPAPVLSQGQTTAVGENAQAVQGQVLEGEATEQRQPSFFDNSTLIWIVAAVWIWYLFGNKKRRQQKAQEKKDKERRENLQKGDNVVTIGRMHGTVVAFTDDSITLKPDNRSDYTMTFDRQAIYRVLPRPGEEEEAAAAADAKK